MTDGDERERLRNELARVEKRCARAAAIIAKKREGKIIMNKEIIKETKKKRLKNVQVKQKQIPSVHVEKMEENERMVRMEHVFKRTMRTIEANQKSVQASSKERYPKKTEVYKEQKVESTNFANLYNRGELPCSIEHRNGSKNGLTWVCNPLELDYFHYLPIFINGIRCEQEPYKFIARQGVIELLTEASGHAESCIIPCLPQIVKGIRLALLTKKHDNIQTALRIIQLLILSNNSLGQALIPFYKQFLSILNLFFTKRQVNSSKASELFTSINETLQLLEKFGGPHAFANIKYMIPTYETSQFVKPIPFVMPVAPQPSQQIATPEDRNLRTSSPSSQPAST